MYVCHRGKYQAETKDLPMGKVTCGVLYYYHSPLNHTNALKHGQTLKLHTVKFTFRKFLEKKYDSIACRLLSRYGVSATCLILTFLGN